MSSVAAWGGRPSSLSRRISCSREERSKTSRFFATLATVEAPPAPTNRPIPTLDTEKRPELRKSLGREHPQRGQPKGARLAITLSRGSGQVRVDVEVHVFGHARFHTCFPPQVPRPARALDDALVAMTHPGRTQSGPFRTETRARSLWTRTQVGAAMPGGSRTLPHEDPLHRTRRTSPSSAEQPEQDEVLLPPHIHTHTHTRSRTPGTLMRRPASTRMRRRCARAMARGYGADGQTPRRPS